jgi:hypothetical protein
MGAHQEAVRLLRRVPVSSEDRETAAMINCVQGVFSTVFYDEETRISYPQDSDDEDFDLSKDPHGTAFDLLRSSFQDLHCACSLDRL